MIVTLGPRVGARADKLMSAIDNPTKKTDGPLPAPIETLDFLFVRFAKVVCLSLPHNVAWLDLVR